MHESDAEKQHQTSQPFDGEQDTNARDAPPDASKLSDATVLSSGENLPRLEGSQARTSDLGRVLEGQKLNHFRLDAFVGGGGMGAAPAAAARWARWSA